MSAVVRFTSTWYMHCISAQTDPTLNKPPTPALWRTRSLCCRVQTCRWKGRWRPLCDACWRSLSVAGCCAEDSPLTGHGSEPLVWSVQRWTLAHPVGPISLFFLKPNFMAPHKFSNLIVLRNLFHLYSYHCCEEQSVTVLWRSRMLWKRSNH